MQPNVLFIVLDTARADIVYSMMDSGDLPALEKFSNEGTRFENAYSTSPWTLPSHASMFTGQRSSDHATHAGNKVFDPTVPPLPEVLSSEGYETRGITGNSWVSSEFGFDQGFDILSTKWDRFWGGADLSAIAKTDGFDKVKTFLRVLGNRQAPITAANMLYEKVIGNRTDFGASRTTTRTINWLHSRSDEDPFFYFINYLEPHLPYEPPSEYKEEFLSAGVDDESVNQNAWEYVAGNLEMSESDFTVLKSLYRAELAYLDSHLGRLYEALEESGYLDSTAVVIVGDHGENIGEHGLMDHQYSLHDTLLHVPLIIRYPPMFDAENNTDFFELRDLYPTILSMAEAEIPSDDSISTVDMTAADSREAVFAEYRYPQPDMDSLRENVSNLSDEYHELDRTLRSIRTSNWKLIEAEDGSLQLYRSGKESEDVSQSQSEVADHLRNRMEQAGIILSREEKRDTQMSEQTQERLKDLGYI